jgi:hypothetical protein
VPVRSVDHSVDRYIVHPDHTRRHDHYELIEDRSRSEMFWLSRLSAEPTWNFAAEFTNWCGETDDVLYPLPGDIFR